MATLANRGLIASDGFAGLRQICRVMAGRPAAFDSRADLAGRWASIDDGSATMTREAAIETQARVLLDRYGVVFRRLLDRETNAAPWRDLLRVYWRLEARGEIRGGRFVNGVSGQQFALPEAVERLRELRRTEPDHRVVAISAADPLNLTGVLTSGERVRAVAGNRIAYRDGVPLAALEGEYLRPLLPLDPDTATEVTAALTGRRIAVTSGYIGRPVSHSRF